MELELHKGRPADKRIDKEERCYALLDSLGIEYYRVDHEHADTIEACHGIESASTMSTRTQLRPATA